MHPSRRVEIWKVVVASGKAGAMCDRLVSASEVPDRMTVAILMPVKESLLSPAEQHILALCANGFRVREIAAVRSVSVETVRTQVSGLKRKLQVHSICHAVAEAIRLGLIH